MNTHYRLKDRFDAGSHGEVWKATANADGNSANAPRFVLKRLFLQLGEEMVHMGLREAHFGEILAGEPHVARFVEYFFRPPLTSESSSSSTVSPKPRASGKRGSDSSAHDSNDAAARTPELWLVFHDEGMSLRHFLYEKQETFAQGHGASGVILQHSRFWEKMRGDAKGELVLREIMRQLLEGVAALHERGITHRDIKPSNILLTIPTVAGGTNTTFPIVKLADFGSAVDEYAAQHLYPPDSGPSQAEETREYQPPEVLFSTDGRPYDYEFPLAYDMWSVGVVFLEMVLGSPQVFLISSRAQAKLDAELQQRQNERKKNHTKKNYSATTHEEQNSAAQQSKSYLLHVLTHEFCIFRPPPHQLRSLWDKYALVSDSCHFGKFNETVVARDPLHKGLAMPFALDLMWKLLQWSPRDRISARDALNHAYFRGPYTCARTGRRFSTEKELHVHERYLRTQAARDNALAFVVRERVPLPGDERDGSHAFVCPKCKRSFATLDSCEHHTHARNHYSVNGSQFCTFNADRVLDSVRRETYHSNTLAFVNLSSSSDSLLTTKASFDVGMAMFQGRKKYMEDFVLVQPAPGLADTPVEANKKDSPVIFAVSDGHLGDAAATFVLEHLVETLTRNFVAIPQDSDENEAILNLKLTRASDRQHQEEIAIRQTFLELHQRFLLESANANLNDVDDTGDEALFSGCTLTVVVLFPRENRVVAANVGDSRAFAWLPEAANATTTDEFAVKPLSMDHWPDVPSERSRIESSGGFVHFQGLWRVVGQLAVSRSLGDRHLRRFVTAEPSVFHVDLPAPNQGVGSLLVLASDGLWETMDSAQVSRIIFERCKQAGGLPSVDLDALAAELAAQSYVRGGLDNTAVLLVQLP